MCFFSRERATRDENVLGMDSAISELRTNSRTFTNWCRDMSIKPFEASPEHYLDYMSGQGVYGQYMELDAISRIYQRPIIIFQVIKYTIVIYLMLVF